jgi:hypothetical protein
MYIQNDTDAKSENDSSTETGDEADDGSEVAGLPSTPIIAPLEFQPPLLFPSLPLMRYLADTSKKVNCGCFYTATNSEVVLIKNFTLF